MFKNLVSDSTLALALWLLWLLWLLLSRAVSGPRLSAVPGGTRDCSREREPQALAGKHTMTVLEWNCPSLAATQLKFMLMVPAFILSIFCSLMEEMISEAELFASKRTMCGYVLDELNSPERVAVSRVKP